MMTREILLLNPPSEKNLQRDFICSSSSKADYYWPPIDFVVLSGILENYDLHIIDAIADQRSGTYLTEFIQNEKIDFLISLVSSIEFDKEIKLLNRLKEVTPGINIIAIGDVAFFEKERVIQNSCIDDVLLDFTSRQLIRYLQNPRDTTILDMIYKINDQVIFNGLQKKNTFSYGKANLTLISLRRYSIPYSMYHPVAPILINYGCPFRCFFCPSGNIGYKIRDLEEIKKEILDFEIQGFKEMFIRDFTFIN